MKLAQEVFAEVRRLFFAEHWKVGTIAAELGLHHKTVAKAVETDRFVAASAQMRPSIVDPYKAFIAATLEKHPKLRATRLMEMIQPRGYPGSCNQLRRYVATVRPKTRAEAFLKLQTFPGEQGQVDWGHFGKIDVGRARRTLSCFVLVLSWSRAIYARFALDQTMESFLRGHVEAFTALGGVPRGILYDNLKSVVLERMGDRIRFHPRSLDLAGHYHFVPKPCAPFRGNEKGKVERTIQYLRHGFFAARRFSSVEDLNAQLAEWIARVANRRRVPGDPSGRLVESALEEERARLLPLPQHPFECDLLQPIASGKQPYVRFDLNDYSIPHDRIQQPLTLAASATTVRILDGTIELARHSRTYDRGRVVENPAHLAALAREKRHAADLRGRDRLSNACKNAGAFLDGLAKRGEPLQGHTSRLLVLLDRYGAAELDAALAEVISRGALGSGSVAHVLDRRAHARRAAPPVDVVLPEHVRGVRIEPHDLKTYDRLTNEPEDTE